MTLIECDTVRESLSQHEFDALRDRRREALVVLMRAENPLLNAVAVAATRNRAWMSNERELLTEIQTWLREQHKRELGTRPKPGRRYRSGGEGHR